MFVLGLPGSGLQPDGEVWIGIRGGGCLLLAAPVTSSKKQNKTQKLHLPSSLGNS